MIFPIYQFDIQPSWSEFIIPPKWYKDILVFLTFNVFVTIGNILPKIKRLPSQKYIVLLIILRVMIVLIFFALCNYIPEGEDRSKTTIPVLIKNDWVYWFGSALAPSSFGYTTSLLMMYIPKYVFFNNYDIFLFYSNMYLFYKTYKKCRQVEPELVGHASMLSALVLAIGVVCGLQLTHVYKLIVLKKRFLH
jgi:hypothetical protein